MAGTVNLTKSLKRQGLDPRIKYEAIVVNNNDPRKLGRIKARIEGIFDGIADNFLPWAIPLYNHVDGAKGGNKRSGIFFVPKVGSKITISFFEGDPHFPTWSGYAIDESTKMPESEKNYPDRAVIRFQNGSYLIIDTRTNEIFLNNPGDMNITVMGDVNQTIIGNQTLMVSDRKNDIPSYLLNAQDTELNKLNPQPSKIIPFAGLLKKANAGCQHTTITGDQTVHIKGNRKLIIDGDNTRVVNGKEDIKISDNQTITAKNIFLN